MSSNELCDVIKKHRPKVSKSTVSTYCSRIRALNKAMKIDIKSKFDVMRNCDDILKHLEDYNINNRKTILSALVVLVDDPEKNSKGQGKCLAKLRVKMEADLKIVKDKDRRQELSESQKKNFIKWEEVLEVYKELEDLVEPIFKKKGMTLEERQIVQRYVILSLYVLVPPRRIKDYLDVKVKDVDKEKDNYIQGGRNPRFFFNSYKNAAKVGTQIVDIPPKLYDILKRWLHEHKNKWLLVNGAFKKPAASYITKILNGIFEKKVSVSMLRHIYLSHKFGDVNLDELKSITEDMGNSKIERTLAYVSKEHANDEKKKDEE